MIISTDARSSWMAALLSELSELNPGPQQRAEYWLQQQGVSADRLTPLSGYTNHVFLVEQSAAVFPKRSVLRLADASLSADLCPLAHRLDAVVQRHIEAAELGLAPEVIAADREAGVMWLEYVGERKVLGVGDFAELREMLAGLYSSGLDWSGGEQVSLKVLLLQLFADMRKKGCRNSRASTPLNSRIVSSSRALSGVEGQKSGHGITFTPPPLVEEGLGTELAQTLFQQAQQRGYFDYPLVPIHGDLNPGNLLHDGQRWWVIDWDFSGMQLYEWDMAGLIVEHGWELDQALAFAPSMVRAEIKWFCSCFALLSWHWHQQRGSEQGIIAAKENTMRYWITLKG